MNNKAPAAHKARKRFGQHFLSDAGVIDQIVDLITPQKTTKEDNQAPPALIEIGPGLAALTTPLLARIKEKNSKLNQSQKLTVIELDRDLAARLKQNPNLDVIEKDVLKVDFIELLEKMRQTSGGEIQICGNLPYNISTPILFHLLPAAHLIKSQHFMLQKEVIDRMIAKPSTAAYGRLSVMLQWRYQMQSQLDISPDAFDPPPRVWSSIVQMQPYQNPAKLNYQILEEIVQTAFSQRRKLIRHTLGKWLDAKNYEGQFDTQRRAEEIPVDQYINLAAQITNQTTN